MDSILFWSAVSNECNRLDHTNQPTNPALNRGPTRSSRATAMSHIAMHDAYFGVAGFSGLPGGTPKTLYLTAPPVYVGTATDAELASAVSGAASTILTLLYPPYRGMIEAKVAELAASRGASATAFTHGEKVALAVWKLRLGDGGDNALDAGHISSPAVYHHRPDPASPGQGYHGVAYGSTKPFVLNTVAPLDPYPAPGTPTYEDNVREVIERGGAPLLNGTKRTPDQTAIGLFWGYDGAERIGTPPRLYNQVLAKIATSMSNTEAENARLFGLANSAMGDCGIYAWREKYVQDLWRPVVGVREHDVHAVGPSVTDAIADKKVTPPCDPFWLPLGRPASNKPGEFSRTPDFPAYPSGHATFGAAVFETVRRFYQEKDPVTHSYAFDVEDNIGFTFVSDELNGSTIDPDGTLRARHNRRFDSVAEAMYDNSISRIYLGVHWRFDGTSGKSVKKMLEATDRIGGVPLGRDIATQIFNGFHQP
jgi:Vanadium chloroperoxidase N-terminal domain